MADRIQEVRQFKSDTTSPTLVQVGSLRYQFFRQSRCLPIALPYYGYGLVSVCEQGPVSCLHEELWSERV